MTATIFQPQATYAASKSDAASSNVAKPLAKEGLADGTVDKGGFAETMEQALESNDSKDALAEGVLLSSDEGELLPLDGKNLPLESVESIESEEATVLPGFAAATKTEVDGDGKLYLSDKVLNKETHLENASLNKAEKRLSGFESAIKSPINLKENIAKHDSTAGLVKTNVDGDLSQKSDLAKQFQLRSEVATNQEAVRELPAVALLKNNASIAVPVVSPMVKISENFVSSKSDVKSIAIAEEALSNVSLTSALKTDAVSAAKGLPVVTVASPYTSNVWGDELSGTVRYLVSKNIQNAEIRINPQNLGPIEIKISMVNEQPNVQFLSQFPQVREALEQALPRLRDMMGESGVELGDAGVSDHSFDNDQNNQEKLNSDLHNSYVLDEDVDAESVITTQVNIRAESTIDYYV